MISPRLPFSIVDNLDTTLETTVFVEENLNIPDFSEVLTHDFQKD